MTNAEIIGYIVLPALLVLCFMMLVLSSQIFVTESVDKPDLRPRAPHVPRHRVDDFDDVTTIIDLETFNAMEQWPVLGRRGAQSPIRQTPVHSEWHPVIGARRIDTFIMLMQTNTAQYLFARRPNDQLDTTRPQFIRNYMVAQ
jgi:hypothetical protein